MEPCVTKCTVETEKTFPCGHKLRISCCDINKATCRERCSKSLPCGHTCQQQCIDTCQCNILTMKTLQWGHKKQMKCSADPDDSVCDITCSSLLVCGHQCKNNCRDPCQTYCTERVVKQVPLCGHDIEVDCGIQMEKIQCSNQCSVILVCGHRCVNKCGASCTSKCQIKVSIELDCRHKQNTECWKQDESVECTGLCAKKLPCGHRCVQKCGDPCEQRCKVKVEKVMKGCNHRQTLLCHVDPEDHVCQVRCKRKLKCGHRCKMRCGEPCDCGVTWKKKLPRCGHIQSVACQTKVTDHICQERCEKILPCRHMCINKCGEPCESRCPQEVNKTLPDCKHRHFMPCYVHPRDFKCPSKCNRMLGCGHKCLKICSEPCEDPSIQQCQLQCMRKLKCGHRCKNKCADPCNEVCQKAVKKSLRIVTICTCWLVMKMQRTSSATNNVLRNFPADINVALLVESHVDAMRNA